MTPPELRCPNMRPEAAGRNHTTRRAAFWPAGVASGATERSSWSANGRSDRLMRAPRVVGLRALRGLKCAGVGCSTYPQTSHSGTEDE